MIRSMMLTKPAIIMVKAKSRMVDQMHEAPIIPVGFKGGDSGSKEVKGLGSSGAN